MYGHDTWYGSSCRIDNNSAFFNTFKGKALSSHTEVAGAGEILRYYTIQIR